MTKTGNGLNLKGKDEKTDSESPGNELSGRMKNQE